MSSYVNLLSDTEIHYHSVASDSRTVKYAMFGVGALLALIAAISFVSYKSATAKAEKLRARWVHVEPAYETAIKNKTQLREAETMLGELKGWPHARLEASELLGSLQTHVPKEMQITRLTVQGTIAGVESSGRRDWSNTQSTKLTEPERLYNLRIEGLVVDEFGEKIILNFIKTLREQEDFAKYFNNVDFKEALPTVIQHWETRKDMNAQRFSIECQFKPRKIKWTGKA